MTQTPAISELFQRALQLPAGPERDNWVHENCQGDEKLESDVRQMLRVHQRASGFLSRPAELNVENAHVGRKSVFGELQKQWSLPEQNLDQTLADSETAFFELPDARYQLHGEIARGGMGAILKARDVDLGRSLAIKVLLDSHRDNEAVVERFIEEAQIGGQLQHPGIAPVYELGQMPDDRPFFSMKLVKGDTLAMILKERKNPQTDRAKLLSIFEQMCQTMAYAHSRRVIHRDLKPANIMVGSFGEVQVMDWGLAKVMKVGGIADEQRARATNLGHSMIQTVRSGSNSPQASIGTKRGAGSAGSDTQAGSVMGTPAYMPPEQALGEVERLDERCDVFGLGAILCEVLTGEPPYVSDDGHDLFRQAARGKLVDCFARIDGSGADETLRNIAKRCLEPEVENRTRNARELSDQITEYLESVEQRLRETEVERAAEATRAVEERKRRRVTTLLATSAVLLCALCGAGWMWMQVQADKRNEAKVAQLNDHLNNARLHQGLAEEGDAQKRLSELRKAKQHAEQAHELVQRDGLGEERKAKVESLLSQLESESKTAGQLVAQQSADQKLSDRLERIRLGHADTASRPGESGDVGPRKSATAEAYAEAFREAGIDLAKMDEQQIAKIIRDSAIGEKLIAGMDHWAASMPRLSYRKLIDAAKAIGDWETGAALTRDYLEIDPKNTLAPLDMAVILVLQGDLAGYEQARHQMLHTHSFPETYLTSERVTKTCCLLPIKPPCKFTIEELPTQVFESALDGKRVQPAMRPYLWNTRALLAYRRGNYDSCLTYVSESENLKPTGAIRMMNAVVRCMAEFRLGREEEARDSFDKVDRGLATANGPAAERRDHNALYALVLRQEAQKLIHAGTKVLTFEQRATSDVADEDREAVRQHRQRKKLLAVANRVDTNQWSKKVRSAIHAKNTESLIKLAESDDVYAQQPELISWFASELRRADQPELAVELLRQVVESHPSDYWINTELGVCLNHVGQSEEAIGFHRSALALRPDSFPAKWRLSLTLELAAQKQASDELFSQLLASDNVKVTSYASIVDRLREQGHHEKAKTIIETWIEKAPQSDEPLRQMSATYFKLGRIEESITWADRALAINPENTLALFRKAWGHSELGQLTESEAAYRRYLELQPDSAGVHNNLGNVIKKRGRIDEAADLFRKAMTLDPKHRYAAKNLSRLLFRQSISDGVAPGSNPELRRLSMRIAQDERTAMEEYRQRLQETPRDVETRLNLARQLIRTREFDASFAEATRAAKISPDSAGPYQVLSEIHRTKGDVDAAIENSRKAIELGEGVDADAERVTLARLLVDKAIGRKPSGGSGFSSISADLIPEDLGSIALIDEAIELLQEIESATSNLEGYSQLLVEQRGPLMLQRLLRIRGRDEEADQIVIRLPGGEDSSTLTSPADANRTVAALSQLRARVKPLRDSGKLAEAIEVVKQHIDVEDEGTLDASFVQGLLADLYLANDQDQKAIAIWKKLAQDDEAKLSIKSLAIDKLLQHYRSLGLVKEIEKLAQDASKSVSRTEPANPKAIQNLSKIKLELADAYADQGRHEDELRTLREATAIRRNLNPFMRRYLSTRLYELTGDSQKALDELGSFPFPLPAFIDFEALLLAIDPPADQRVVRLNQALSLAKQASRRPMGAKGGSGGFRDLLRRFYRTDPESQWSFSGRNTLGIVHYRRGEYDDALKALMEFHEMKFTEPSNWLFLAMTNWQLGNKDEARNWYSKAIEFLDQEGYQPTRMEKLFRKEANVLIGEEVK